MEIEIMTTAQVAELLDCTPRTVEDNARAGYYAGIKAGRKWMFPRTALLESLNRLAHENVIQKVHVSIPQLEKKRAGPNLWT